jgi:hypothetical protein
MCPGPPPKHPSARARRNNPKAGFRVLPAGGREGTAPAWPLWSSSEAELALWADLWSTPQAAIWEEAHSERVVALYIRQQLAAEDGDMKAATEARQLGDRLGLNPLALMRLRMEIEHTDKAEDEGRKRRQSPPKPKVEPEDPRGDLYAVS